MLDQLRSLLRSTGLTRRLSKLFSRLEEWRLAQYGSLVQRRISAEVSELVSARGTTYCLGPPKHYAEMMLSRHELPTLVAFLNVFAPVVKNGIVWDVGGNAGFYSALLAQVAGHEGQVYAFEPVPSTYQSMCANLKIAGASKVTTMNVALSDQDGELPISFDPLNDTTSSLESASGASAIKVRVATGDSLIAGGDCLPPTVLKIDIEGHELKALKGMRSLLARSECRAVLCEVHFSILASSGERYPAAKARAMLAHAGFDHITFISRSHMIATKGRF